MKSGGRLFCLTNTHGLRLMIVSGRVGAPPRALSGAKDATDLTGGLPLVSAPPLPSELPEAEGAVIALELKTRTRLHAALHERLAASPDEMVVADAPFALSQVRRAVFADEQQAIEFRAGLQTLGVDDARVDLRSEPALFPQVLWGPPEAPHEANADLGRLWTAHLDLQERVSSALIIGSAVASGRTWPQAKVRSLREQTPTGKKVARSVDRLRRCGSAIARLDPLRGWTAEDLLAGLRGPRGDAELAAFAEGYAASADPFADGDPPGVKDAADEAIAFLVDHQGLTATEMVGALVGDRETGASTADVPPVTPLAAALVALAIGRSQVPPKLRPRKRDARFIDAELKAAGDAIAAHREQSAWMDSKQGPVMPA